MATCMITNCRKPAPSSEPFCVDHRDPPTWEQKYNAAMHNWDVEVKALQDKLDAAVREAEGWKESAAHFASGQDFYRGIVRRVGELYGVEARTSDDGSIQQDVLALKVPELVAHYMKQAADCAAREKESAFRLDEATKRIADLEAKAYAAGVAAGKERERANELHRRCQLAEGAVERKMKAEQAAGAPLAKRLAMAGYAAEQEKRLECERRLEGTLLQLESWKSAYEKITAGDYAEVRLDTDGAIDEVVGSGVFHVEQMDTNRWFFDLAGCRFNIDGKKVTLTPIEVDTWAEEQKRLVVETPQRIPVYDEMDAELEGRAEVLNKSHVVERHEHEWSSPSFGQVTCNQCGAVEIRR